MGKGAFRGSLHFCGQARQSARTRSKRPFPANRRRGSGDSTRISRQAGRRRPGIRPLPRFRAGRHPYRHPTALPGCRTNRHPLYPADTRPGHARPGPSRAIPVCQQPVPAAGIPLPAPTEQTCCRASLICQRPATTTAMTAAAFVPAGGRGPGLRYRVPGMQKIRCAGSRTKARAARKRAETAHTYLYPFAVQILKSLTCFGSRA